MWLFFFPLRHLTNVSVKVSGCRRWTRPHWQREERWKRPVPAQRPAAAPVRAPTLPRPPHSLRRRPSQGGKQPRSPLSARQSVRLSTHRWRRWGWIPSMKHHIQLSTSQDNKRKYEVLMFSCTMDGRTSVETALSSLSTPAPLCLWLDCMVHQHVSGKQACSRSNNRHLSMSHY